MSSFLSKYKLPLLFLAAFLIRLIHLDQSLWLDEATTAITVKTFAFWDIVTQFSPADFHPPLYYLFMDLWTAVFGYSEIALRMPSVLFSLGAGWFIYKTVTSYLPGRPAGELRVNGSLRDDKVAFWSAAFFLFNPLIIYYSQEARMYMMVTFLIAANFYFLQILLQKPKQIDHLFFHLTLGAMFLTFYASVFYIATVFLYFVLMKKYRLFLLSLGMWSLSFLFISPLLYTQYTGSRIALESVKNWSLVLGNVNLKNLALIPIKFTSGRISFEPKLWYYALAGGWVLVTCGLVCVSVIADLIRNLGIKKAGSRRTAMLVYFLITPLILGIIFSFTSPLLQYFRFQYLIIFLSILLAITVIQKGSLGSLRSLGMTMFLLFGFLAWSLLYLLLPQFHREDWTGLARQLQEEGLPLYMIQSSADPLKYYAPELEVRALQGLSDLGTLEKEIIIIPYTADIHGVDYKDTLQGSSYSLQSTTSVRELQYEVWSLK